MNGLGELRMVKFGVGWYFVFTLEEAVGFGSMKICVLLGKASQFYISEVQYLYRIGFYLLCNSTTNRWNCNSWSHKKLLIFKQVAWTEHVLKLRRLLESKLLSASKRSPRRLSNAPTTKEWRSTWCRNSLGNSQFEARRGKRRARKVHFVVVAQSRKFPSNQFRWLPRK